MSPLECVKFSHDIGQLKPAINEVGFDIHYNKIYKKLVDDFNQGVGDFAFNNQGTSEMKPADPSLQNRRREMLLLTGQVEVSIS